MILFLFFYRSAFFDLSDLNDKIDLLVDFVVVVPLNKWHFYVGLPHVKLGNQFPEFSICESWLNWTVSLFLSRLCFSCSCEIDV